MDSFQGRECEVICMSMVRSKKKDIELGFLNDLRRMNVSLLRLSTLNSRFQVSVTRAKRQFFICANSMTMMESKELTALYGTIKEHGKIVNLSALNLPNVHENRKIENMN